MTVKEALSSAYKFLFFPRERERERERERIGGGLATTDPEGGGAQIGRLHTSLEELVAQIQGLYGFKALLSTAKQTYLSLC